MDRVVLHIDMNAYFASCAQIIYPQYRDKPLAVGGKTSRSIITTASYEARKYGVKSAMPVYMARKLCPELIIVSPNFKIYEEFTHRFVDVIKKYSDIIQMASIDECFADVSNKIRENIDPMDYAREIQNDILRTTGLRCSIGVAPNKFLAKMASDMKKPMGLTLLNVNNLAEKMWPLPIGDMFGIGKKSAEMLKLIGINTIGDLANYTNQLLLQRKFGKSYFTIMNWAHGIDESEVSDEEFDSKSVGNSRTMLNDTTDYAELKSLLRHLADMVSKRAIEDQLYGKTVSIKIRYSDFTNIDRSKKLQEPTNSFEDIFVNALALFDKNYQEGRPVRLLGVTLQDVAKIDHFVKQLSIYDSVPTKKASNDVVNHLIADLNKKLGKECLVVASKVKKEAKK